MNSSQRLDRQEITVWPFPAGELGLGGRSDLKELALVRQRRLSDLWEHAALQG